MILSYHVSMAGPHHLQTGKPCQDAYAIRQDKAPFHIAAVADGLGSELYSDIGASVAAHTAVDHCAEHLEAGMDFDEIKKIMNNALVYAYQAVLTRADDDQHDPDEYDSTLCLCIYNGEQLYYAQSGDSGLIVLLESGEYRRLTTQQRDEEGRVFPLCWGPEKWVFGQVEEPVSAALLMTDGMFEKVCHPMLRGKDIDINIPLAGKLMDHFDCSEDTLADRAAMIHQYLENFPRLDDDKTVAALINTDRAPAEMPPEYYAAPDWKALDEEAKRKLYPQVETACDTASAAENTAPDQTQAEPPADEQDAQADQPSTPDPPAPKNDAPNNAQSSDPAPSGTPGAGESPQPPETGQPPAKKPNATGRRRKRAASRRKKLWLNLAAFAFVLAFSLLACFVGDFMTKHAALTAAGVFLSCFLAHTTGLLPTASLLVAVEYSMFINPVLVALCAAAGAALGEATGFLAGKCRQRFIPLKLYNWLCKRLEHHKAAMVLVFSALPFPICDFSAVSGMKMPMFLSACFCGKLMKFLVYALIAPTISTLT